MLCKNINKNKLTRTPTYNHVDVRNSQTESRKQFDKYRQKKLLFFKKYNINQIIESRD